MLYLLPTLFTFSSMFCGLLAIRWSLGGHEPLHYYLAAIAILFAAFFDLVDGRVARLTRTESDIGVQLDSLADLISFGLAPAMLVYAWGLKGTLLGSFDLGLLICFAFLAAGAFRLARFNVSVMRESRLKGAPSPVFTGLPIPVAACLLAGLVLAHHQTDVLLYKRRLLLLLLVPLLSWLMVSKVPYRTFKRLRFTRQRVLLSLAALIPALLIARGVAPAVTLVLGLATYITAGLAGYLVGFSRERHLAATVSEDTTLTCAEREAGPTCGSPRS